jgi:hypothetical protein
MIIIMKFIERKKHEIKLNELSACFNVSNHCLVYTFFNEKASPKSSIQSRSRPMKKKEEKDHFACVQCMINIIIMIHIQ